MVLTRRIAFAALALFFLIAPASVEARQIALAWDPNPEPEVTGYTLLYGTQPGVYPNSVNVGNLISYQIDLPGVQYYFAIRAYTATGLTSPLSTEVAESSAIALNDPGLQSDAPGFTVSLQLTATGTPASYTATNLPGGLSINTTTGRISGIISAGAGASSPYLVKATVSNAAGNTSSVQFTWTIAVNRAPTLTSPGNQSSAASATVSLQLVASDLDGDPLTYSATGLPASLTVNAASGLISGTLSGTSGTSSVTATASDGVLSNSKTFTWTVTGGVNQAPTLTAPGNQTSVEGAADSLQLVASDPDGNALTYSATGLPPSLTVNATSGLISGTLAAATAGTYSVTATVSDGLLTNSKSFTWTVTASTGSTTVDLSPQDTYTSLNTTNYATTNTLNVYTFPPNQVANTILMKFGLSQIPAGATIISATLNANLVEVDSFPAEPTYSVSLHKVINRNPDITTATGFTYDGVNGWTANTCCMSGIPMAQADISAARSTTAVNRTFGFKTWDATSTVQEWLTTPATNFGLLLNSDVSKAADRYRYFASMEHATTSLRPFLRVVYSVSGNQAPTLTAPGNQTSVENTADSLQLVATDPDGNPLTYSATGLPPTLTVNATTGLISGMPSFASAGTYTVTATATDGSMSNSKTFTWTVTNTNQGPTLTSPGNQTSVENAVISLQLVASDPDGTALTYSATGLPSPLNVNASTGLISGTLSFASAGTHSVTATVSDGSLSNSKSFTWTVNDVNRAPTLTAPANQTSAAGATVSLQLAASDPDGTGVTYSATGLPASLTVNTATGLISGTLSASAGVYSVTATASDGSLTNSKTFTWTVTSPSGPVTALTVTANLAAPQTPGTTITLTAAATGGTAPYQFKWWVMSAGGWTILQDWNAAASYAWTPTSPNPQGMVEVWVRSAGNSANMSEKWADLPFAIQSPLTVTANRTAPQTPGTPITFTAIGASGIAPYQFKWWLSSATGWTVLQDWNAAASYTWTPSTTNPQGLVEVWVRSAGNSANAPERYADLPFAILPPLTLTANLASPQPTGTSITFTAAAAGGTAPYQFKYWLSSATGWTVLQDWNAAASYTWTPTTGNPQGMVEVWMRSAGNSADAPEKWFDLPYVILSPPITALTVTADRTAPQPPGTNITLTATPTGGTAPCEFKWWVFGAGGWTVLQDWTAGASYTWTPTTTNPQGLVEVWVRSAGSAATAPEKYADLPFVIQ